MHQNQILNEDLSTPSKIRFDAGLDGGRRSSDTIHRLRMVLEDLPRPSKIRFDAQTDSDSQRFYAHGWDGFMHPDKLSIGPDQTFTIPMDRTTE